MIAHVSGKRFSGEPMACLIPVAETGHGVFEAMQQEMTRFRILSKNRGKRENGNARLH